MSAYWIPQEQKLIFWHGPNFFSYTLLRNTKRFDEKVIIDDPWRFCEQNKLKHAVRNLIFCGGKFDRLMAYFHCLTLYDTTDQASNYKSRGGSQTSTGVLY